MKNIDDEISSPRSFDNYWCIDVILHGNGMNPCWATVHLLATSTAGGPTFGYLQKTKRKKKTSKLGPVLHTSVTMHGL